MEENAHAIARSNCSFACEQQRVKSLCLFFFFFVFVEKSFIFEFYFHPTRTKKKKIEIEFQPPLLPPSLPLNKQLSFLFCFFFFFWFVAHSFSFLSVVYFPVFISYHFFPQIFFLLLSQCFALVLFIFNWSIELPFALMKKRKLLSPLHCTATFVSVSFFVFLHLRIEFFILICVTNIVEKQKLRPKKWNIQMNYCNFFVRRQFF